MGRDTRYDCPQHKVQRGLGDSQDRGEFVDDCQRDLILEEEENRDRRCRSSHYERDRGPTRERDRERERERQREGEREIKVREREICKGEDDIT
jgi:hypothetical protein